MRGAGLQTRSRTKEKSPKQFETLSKESKKQEDEHAIGNSIIGRLHQLLQMKSYKLTQDEEGYLMRYAYAHRDFTDDLIMGFIDGMRKDQHNDMNRHVVEMEKTGTSMEQVLKHLNECSANQAKNTMDIRSATSELMSCMISLKPATLPTLPQTVSIETSSLKAGLQVDNKPDLKEYITLKVLDRDRNEVFFRIKRDTQLKELMNAYCDRQSVDIDSIVFLFDGIKLRGEHTPDEFEMKDGDEIHVWRRIRGC